MLSTLPYAEIYNADPDNYPYTILKKDITPKVYFALYQEGIRKVSQLLQLSPYELSQFKNIGTSHFNQTEKYINGILSGRIILNSTDPDKADLFRTTYEVFYGVDSKDYDYLIDMGMLNTRVSGSLTRAYKLYVSDLLNMTPESLRRIRNIGEKGAQIIEEYIKSQI